MKPLELFNPDRVKRKEIKQAARAESSRINETPDTKRFFNLFFEKHDDHDPRHLRVSLLGKAVAVGVQGGNSRAISIITTAANIAESAHKGTPRNLSSDPYILHPYRAAFLTIELAEQMGIPLTPELIAGAILHDAVEDKPEVTQEYIYKKFKKFGENLAGRIAGDAEALSKYTNGEKLDPEDYAQKIMQAPTRATLLRRLIIKSADRIDNLLDPPISPKVKDQSDPLWYKRKKIINKTNRDLMTLLNSSERGMPVGTDRLVGIVTTAVTLAQSTLDQDHFDPTQWQSYLPQTT